MLMHELYSAVQARGSCPARRPCMLPSCFGNRATAGPQEASIKELANPKFKRESRLRQAESCVSVSICHSR